MLDDGGRQVRVLQDRRRQRRIMLLDGRQDGLDRWMRAWSQTCCGDIPRRKILKGFPDNLNILG
jgi:hypothetical protein